VTAPCRCERDNYGKLTYVCDDCTLAAMRREGDERRWWDEGPDDENDPAVWPDGQGRYGPKPGYGL
jgi:hypothetical protein